MKEQTLIEEFGVSAKAEQLEVCPQILNVLKIQRFILNPFSPHVTNLQSSNKSTKFSITLKENNTEDNFLGNWKQIQG